MTQKPTKTPASMDERAEMMEMYRQLGTSYTAIGRKFGISGERVRMLMKIRRRSYEPIDVDALHEFGFKGMPPDDPYVIGVARAAIAQLTRFLA